MVIERMGVYGIIYGGDKYEKNNMEEDVSDSWCTSDHNGNCIGYTEQ